MRSVLLVFLGTTLYSTGVILQKKGSEWMAGKRSGKNGFLPLFCLWLAGLFVSYVLSALPNGIASRQLPPHIVSAFSGWGIVVVALLSHFYLKESLYRSDIFYSLAIAGAIFVLSFVQKEDASYSIDREELYIYLLLPSILLLPVLFRSPDRRLKTVLLSMFSGGMGGMTIVLMNVLMKVDGNSLSDLLHSQYIYVYLLTGIISMIANQAAYRLGDVILIAPFQTACAILYPVICSAFLFHMEVMVIQIAGIAVIIYSCIGILRKRVV